MYGYMAIFGTLIGSMLFAIIQIFMPRSTPIQWDAFVIAFFWAAYNSYVIFSALQEVFRKKHDRKQYRFQINTEGRLYGVHGHLPFMKVHVLDLSIAGAGFLVDQKMPSDSPNMLLKVSPVGFKDFFIPVEQIRYQHNHPSGKILIGSSFPDNVGPQRDRLFEYLFIHLPRVVDANSLYHVNQWDPVRYIQTWSQKVFLRNPEHQ